MDDGHCCNCLLAVAPPPRVEWNQLRPLSAQLAASAPPLSHSLSCPTHPSLNSIPSTSTPVPSYTMSFNDLERGTTSSPTSRSSPRPNRPSSSGPLPLYHAPRSAYRDDDDDDDTDNAATKSPLTPNQQAEFKRLADSIGTQIFKINSNTTAIDKLVKLAGQRHKRDDTPTDWTKRS